MRATSATETVVDALAVHRLTRLVQDDEVWPMPELREAYLRRVGESRWADLASCPWCLSWWIAVLVVVVRHRWPRAWPWIARALAGSAVAGHLAQLLA
jgi:hypothetical protein